MVYKCFTPYLWSDCIGDCIDFLFLSFDSGLLLNIGYCVQGVLQY